MILPKNVLQMYNKLPKNVLQMSYKLPKNVLQMYSDIWLPDFDSEKWLSSLFNIRLNWKKQQS